MKRKKEDFFKGELKSRLEKLVKDHRSSCVLSEPEELDLEFHSTLHEIKIQLGQLQKIEIGNSFILKNIKQINLFFCSNLNDIFENFQFIISDHFFGDILQLCGLSFMRGNEKIYRQLLTSLVILTSIRIELASAIFEPAIWLHVEKLYVTRESVDLFLLLLQNLQKVNPIQSAKLLFSSEELLLWIHQNYFFSENFDFWLYLCELMLQLSLSSAIKIYKEQLFQLAMTSFLYDLTDDMLIMCASSIKNALKESRNSCSFQNFELFVKKSSRIFRTSRNKDLVSLLCDIFCRVVTEDFAKAKSATFLKHLIGDFLFLAHEFPSKKNFFNMFFNIVRKVAVDRCDYQKIISAAIQYLSKLAKQKLYSERASVFKFLDEFFGKFHVQVQLEIASLNPELIDSIFEVTNEFDSDMLLFALCLLNQLLEADLFLSRQTRQTTLLDYLLDKNYDVELEKIVLSGHKQISLLAQLIIEKYFSETE